MTIYLNEEQQRKHIASGGIDAEQTLLHQLHVMIDKKFNRTNRSVKIDPIVLKAKMTSWAIADEFVEVDPVVMDMLFRKLVERGSVVTNIDDEGVSPFDIYFIPATEL